MRSFVGFSVFRVLATFWVILAASPALLAAGPMGALFDHERDRMPAVILGALLPELDAHPVTDLGLFRYDPDTGEYVENMYDVLQLEDRTLDGDDEIVFLFRDAGPRVEGEPAWPEGAGPERWEIRVFDPLAGAPVPERWAYLFTGSSLPKSQLTYVGWNLSESSSVQGLDLRLEFEDRWILERMDVPSPCGTGADLIDRLKGRATGESEETWNTLSIYLGGLVGPVRAIRYVRGAASGVNTIHHDVVYPEMWSRTINLRVHPLDDVAIFFDWRPLSGYTFFSPSRAGGVPIDGVQDGAVYGPLEPWTLVRGPDGGLATVYHVPPSPNYDTVEMYYRDDASFDDRPVFPPGYPDEDDSSYGSHGVKLHPIRECNTDAVHIETTYFPLCADVGDAGLGAELYDMLQQPLQVQVALQGKVMQPVRTLVMTRQFVDIVLSWDSVQDAEAYRVYASDYADLPHTSWSLMTETADTTYRDTNGALPPDRFYSVVPVGPLGEGDW